MSTLTQAVEAELKAVLEERDRYLATSGDTIAKLLKTAEGRLLALLADQPSDAAAWMLPQLQAQVRQAMAEFSQQASAEVANLAGQAWEAGQATVDAPLAAGRIAIIGTAPILDTRQLLAMRAFMTDRIHDVGTQAIGNINTQLGLTVLGAQSPSETISVVKDVLGETSRQRALTITRTELSGVYSLAAYERLLQQAQAIPGLKKQWRSSGKAHPRATHLAADGQLRDVDKPFNIGTVEMRYPHDRKAPVAEIINCGCTMLPWHADWGTAMQNAGRKHPAE
jgi:hypothetical protein